MTTIYEALVPGKTWRSGRGVPANSLGSNGEFYLDTSTGNIYERAAGVYTQMTLPSGGGGAGTVTVGAGLDGDGSSGDPVRVEFGTGTNQVRHGDDSAYTNDRTASGIRETGSNTVLAAGSISDLTLVTRSGSSVVGRVPADFSHKSVPILGDKIMLSDSAASNGIKYATISEILALVALNASGSGNPYIDAPATPDAWNDEFSGGDPDLANRGWSVYNFDDNTAMTRVGNITGTPGSTLTAGQYRSTIHGSTLLMQVPGISKRITVLKPCTGSYMFMVRMGVPMGNSSWGGAFITTAASPPYFTAAHNSGNGPGWQLVYIDGTPSMRYLGRTINAASFTDVNVTANVNFSFTLDTFILNHDEATPAQYGTFVNAGSMQSRGSSIGGTNGAAIMATPMASAGFALNAAFSGITASGTNIFCIDYVRRMPVNSWVGF